MSLTSKIKFFGIVIIRLYVAGCLFVAVLSAALGHWAGVVGSLVVPALYAGQALVRGYLRGRPGD